MSAPAVRRRQVFFLSGFDPKGASYYHRLYAEGAGAQAATTGHAYEVGPRLRTDQAQVQQWQISWRASAAESAEPVQTTFEFLAWDDLVRAHWPRGIAGVAWGSVLAYVAALSSGMSLVRVWKQSRRTLIALAYPAVLWLLAIVLGAALGALAAQLALQLDAVKPWAPASRSALVWGLGVAAFATVWWGALRLEQKIHTSWLLRIYRFADLWASGQLPDMEQRLDAMAQRVHACLQRDDADEVLIVGYSVGSMLAVSVTARVLALCERQGQDVAAAAQRLSLLTLGQCIPLLGLMPRARQFRSELQTLAAQPALCWTDYSSPTDWGSFALVDPLQICRIGPPAGQPGLVPRMRSPRFHTLFAPEDYVQLRQSKRRMHLQYLMAAPLVGDYDYFLITAGPWRLCRSGRPDARPERPQ